MVRNDALAARRCRSPLPVLLPVMVLATLAAPCARADAPRIAPFRWLGEVPAGASVAVENPWGDVRLRAGDPGSKLEVLASLQQGGSPAAFPEVQVRPEKGVVTVRVTAPGGKGGRADLVLFVPGKTAVRVETSEGLIEAKGLRGDATLRTDRGGIVSKGVRGNLCASSQSGPLTAELEVATGSSHALESRTGDIVVYLWEDAAVTAEVATSGEISTDFTLQVDYRKFEEPNKRALAVLGEGSARLKVESKQGRVRLLRLPRSFKKDGPDEPEPSRNVRP